MHYVIRGLEYTGIGGNFFYFKLGRTWAVICGNKAQLYVITLVMDSERSRCKMQKL